MSNDKKYYRKINKSNILIKSSYSLSYFNPIDRSIGLKFFVTAVLQIIQLCNLIIVISQNFRENGRTLLNSTNPIQEK